MSRNIDTANMTYTPSSIALLLTDTTAINDFPSTNTHILTANNAIPPACNISRWKIEKAKQTIITMLVDQNWSRVASYFRARQCIVLITYTKGYETIFPNICKLREHLVAIKNSIARKSPL